MRRFVDLFNKTIAFAGGFLLTFVVLILALALTETFSSLRLSIDGSRSAVVVLMAVVSLAVGLWRSRRVGRRAGAPVAAAVAPVRRRDLPPARLREVEAEVPRPTEQDRALAAKVVKDMVAQVRREAELHDGTWPEPLSVRLVPQIPIRDEKTPRSWLGGRPRMPAHMPWPEADGAPCDFMAQIALADLPAGLWQGLGRRDGWLALFLHPTSYTKRLIHIPELGPARDAPQPPAEMDGWHHPYNRHHRSDLQQRYIHRAFPEWPVDVVKNVPEAEVAHSGSALYKSGFDLADPAHHPFDWPGMLALMDSAHAALESHYGKDIPSPNPLEQQLAGLEARLAAGAPPADTGEQSVPYTPEKIVEMEHRVRALRELIPASAEARQLGLSALATVREIAAEVRADSAQYPFTAERAERLLRRLQVIRWMKVLRRRDPAGRPGAEVIETLVLPITAHHPDASLFAWDYHALHFDMARHAYCRDMASLPMAARALYEPLWRGLAASSAPRLGGFPRGYVSTFSPDADVLVLELPTSQLMGWMFGDADNLVLIMRQAEIAASRFDEARVDVSN